MQGVIFVDAFMQSQKRAVEDRKRFEHRQMLIRVSNALWAYHRSENKAEVVQTYSEEFDWLNERKGKTAC